MKWRPWQHPLDLAIQIKVSLKKAMQNNMPKTVSNQEEKENQVCMKQMEDLKAWKDFLEVKKDYQI